MKYDFTGWATKNNVKCSDGRIINKNAFKHNDGQVVPLVWNHQHDSSDNVLGHALLENREDGVYAYCKFNNTTAGENAKTLVTHGDITSLSIYANRLKQDGNAVVHGFIREVSLVLAGANPGAYIDSVMAHSDSSEFEGIIYTDEELVHAAGDTSKDKTIKDENDDSKKDETPEKGETLQDVFDTLTEKQKDVVYAMIGSIIEKENKNNKNNENEGDGDMKHNIFDGAQGKEKEVLSHDDMTAVLNDAKRYGSLKESALQHGITDIEFLFPEAQTINNTPDFIKRDTGWVGNVMSDVHKTPFSRIKSIHADITGEEARALGYIKGKMKKEEVFSLLKRTTDPQTIFKKQKLHRDDVIDITDFDVVAWLKGEMRMMLDEEIARAILIGDGRLASSDDKIHETHIRPVWTDADLYTIKQTLKFESSATDDDKAKAFIRGVIKARKNYKGSGKPNLYCSEDVLTDCLLLEDTTGRILYDSVEKLATALRVKNIITVPVMEGATREVEGKTRSLMGIVVNLNDYNVGADKGGAINMFDDFDIDYNAQKYLIETRCSGALTKPFSAIAVEAEVAQ